MIRKGAEHGRQGVKCVLIADQWMQLKHLQQETIGGLCQILQPILAGRFLAIWQIERYLQFVLMRCYIVDSLSEFWKY